MEVDKKKVIVIGGGCAGLSATYTLKKAGVDVLCLESSGFTGGRCRNEQREDGYNISLGAGMTEPQWDTTFRYLSELGMLDDVVEVKNQKFGMYRNGRLNYILQGTPGETIKSIPELLKFRGLPGKAYPELIRFGKSLKKYQKKVDTKTHNFDALLELGNTSAAEFTLQQRAPEVLDRIISPFLGTMVLGRPEEVVIAHIIALMSLMQGMCVLKHGMGSITAALYEKVKEEVQLNTAVQKVVIENKQVKGVETENGFIEADQVICATDAYIARKIMPDLPDTMRKPLETCNYSSTFGYTFGIDEKLTPKHTIAAFVPAINLESPGQFPAIHDLLENHMNDVKGLHLAGEYLFLIACTEGAFATGEKAAKTVVQDMN